MFVKAVHGPLGLDRVGGDTCQTGKKNRDAETKNNEKETGIARTIADTVNEWRLKRSETESRA